MKTLNAGDRLTFSFGGLTTTFSGEKVYQYLSEKAYGQIDDEEYLEAIADIVFEDFNDNKEICSKLEQSDNDVWFNHLTVEHCNVWIQ